MAKVARQQEASESQLELASGDLSSANSTPNLNFSQRKQIFEREPKQANSRSQTSRQRPPSLGAQNHLLNRSAEFITISLEPATKINQNQDARHRTPEPTDQGSKKAISSSAGNPLTPNGPSKCSSFQTPSNWNASSASAGSLSPQSASRSDTSSKRKINCVALDKEAKNSLESINSKRSSAVASSSDLSIVSVDLVQPGEKVAGSCDCAKNLDLEGATVSMREEDCMASKVDLTQKAFNLAPSQLLDATTLTRNADSTRKSASSTSPEADLVKFADGTGSNQLSPNSSAGAHGSIRKNSKGLEQRRPSSAALRRANMLTKPPFPFAGILAALLSSLFFSLSSLMIKLLPDSDEGEGIQEKMKAMFTRGMLITIVCAITIVVTRSTFKVKRDEIWVNFARALIGSMGVMTLFCSLEFISLGDTTALMFTAPLWTYLLSHFIFAEPLHWVLVFLMPLGLVGIVLISHPTLIIPAAHLSLNHGESLMEVLAELESSSQAPMTTPVEKFVNESMLILYNATSPSAASRDPDPVASSGDHLGERWPGIVISLLGSVFISLTFIVLKFRKSTPIQTTTFYFGIGQMTLALVGMSIVGFGSVPKTANEWTLLLANGILSWIAQSALQWSFSYEEAGVLSIVRTADVAIAFVLSALFLNDDIYWTSIVGSLMLGLVVSLIIVNNWIYKRRHPDDDPHLVFAQNDAIATKQADLATSGAKYRTEEAEKSRS